MSPAYIHILLNHYALADKTYEACSGGVSQQFYDGAVAQMKADGLIADEGGVTPMGAVYVDMICSTPLPVLKYVDPRTNR